MAVKEFERVLKCVFNKSTVTIVVDKISHTMHSQPPGPFELSVSLLIFVMKSAS